MLSISLKGKPAVQMFIMVSKGSIWFHTEMKVPKGTEYMLESSENNCFLSECRNAGRFFISKNINDSRIRTKYVP